MTNSNQIPPRGTDLEHTGLMTEAEIVQLAEHITHLALGLSRASALKGPERKLEILRLLPMLVRASDSAATSIHNKLTAREGVITDETELRIANLFEGFLGRSLTDKELASLVPVLASALQRANTVAPEVIAEQVSPETAVSAVASLVGRPLQANESKVADTANSLELISVLALFIRSVDSTTAGDVEEALKQKREPPQRKATKGSKEEQTANPHAVTAAYLRDRNTPPFTPGFKDPSTLSPRVQDALVDLGILPKHFGESFEPSHSSANTEPMRHPEYYDYPSKNDKRRESRTASAAVISISKLIKSKDYSEDSISHALNKLGMSHCKHHITAHSYSGEEMVRLLIIEAASNGLLRKNEKGKLLASFTKKSMLEFYPSDKSTFGQLVSMVNAVQPGEQREDIKNRIEDAFTVGMISKKERRVLLGRLRDSSAPDQVIAEGIITGVIYKIETLYETIEVPKERFIELALFNGLNAKKVSNLEHAFASVSGTLDYSTLSKVLDSNGMKESSRIILFKQLGLDERALIDLFGLEAKQLPNRRPERDVREGKKPRQICIGPLLTSGNVHEVHTQRIFIPVNVSGVQGIGGSRLKFRPVNSRPLRAKEQKQVGKRFA